MTDTKIMTRYTAECTRNHLRTYRPTDYVVTAATLITWLETIITLHQMLETAGVTISGASVAAGKWQETK